MKSFKQYLAEMDLSREPPDYENIEDRRGKPYKIKAGDRKVKSSAGGGGTYTQAEADAINKKNDFDYPKVNKKYGDSGIPMPKFPKTDNKTVSVEKPKTPSIRVPKPNTKSASVPVPAPKSTNKQTTGTATSVKPGMANPEWIKKHSWIKDAIKQDRVKKDKIAASTTTGGPRGPNGPSSPPSTN